MRQAIEIGSSQDWRGEVRRLFDLQAASRWAVSRSTAAERRKKLQRLKAALEKHRGALGEGIRRDFGRPAEESEFVEFHPIFEELNHAIADVLARVPPAVPSVATTEWDEHVRDVIARLDDARSIR